MFLVHTCVGRAYLCDCVHLRRDHLHVKQNLHVHKLVSFFFGQVVNALLEGAHLNIKHGYYMRADANESKIEGHNSC